MMPTDKQLHRELELQNLAMAFRRGWHTDPRWHEAMRRIEEEQREEREHDNSHA